MLKALVLLAAVVAVQDRVQKIPIKNTDPRVVYERLHRPDKSLVPDGIRRITFDPTDNSLIVQGTSEAIKELQRVIGEIDVPSESRIILIKNVAASYIATLLKQSPDWLPAGVTIDVDPRTNAIVARGSAAGLRELELLITQFDFKPSPVTVELQAVMPRLGRTFSTSGTIANNATLTYSDEATGTTLKVTPRINSSGTVLLVVTGGILGTSNTAFVRMKPGDQSIVRFLPEPDGSGMRIWVATGVASSDALSSDRFSATGVETSVGELSFAPKESELRLLITVSLPKAGA